MAVPVKAMAWAVAAGSEAASLLLETKFKISDYLTRIFSACSEMYHRVNTEIRNVNVLKLTQLLPFAFINRIVDFKILTYCLLVGVHVVCVHEHAHERVW